MRHRVDHRKLGRTSKHRLALMRNMVASLLEHGRITTTLPKAKEARRYAEKVITLGKKALARDRPGAGGDRPGQALHYRRQALSALHSTAAVKQLIEKVAPSTRSARVATPACSRPASASATTARSRSSNWSEPPAAATGGPGRECWTMQQRLAGPAG